MSFRKYGGINYAATHNIVKSKYNTINEVTFQMIIKI